MILRGIKALGSAGHDQADYKNLIANKGFIIGQEFSQMVDLSNSKFSTQIKSSELQGQFYSANLFFHNVLSM